jgi:NADPH-dependent glutamate synthase beta subunit-like oxidoreductase
MQTAVTASQRGHRVILFEKDSEVWGNLRIGSLPFFKEDFRRYFDYARRRLESSDVEVRLHREINLENLKKLAPEIIVVAAVAEMAPLDLPGGEHVDLVVDVLADRKSLGERVILIGAGFV